MASSTPSTGSGVKQNDSIVIDFDGFDDFDSLDAPSDAEFHAKEYTSDSDAGPGDKGGALLDSGAVQSPSGNDADSTDIAAQLRNKIRDDMTDMLWQSGREKATAAFNMYAKIDVLRPYFDVEPIQVRNRLLASFVPVMPTAKKQASIPGDLYGPCMIIFSLIAILLCQMKGKAKGGGLT